MKAVNYRKVLNPGLLALLVSLPAGAAVLTNPTLSTTVDPAGSEKVDLDASTLSGSTLSSLTTINASSGLNVMQTFTDGTTPFAAAISSGATAQNIVSFTSTTVPDLRITVSGNTRGGSSGGQSTVGQANTSGTSAMDFRGNGLPASVTGVIEFGDYTASTFTPFTGGSTGVVRAGFTIANANQVTGTLDGFNVITSLTANSASYVVTFYNGATSLASITASPSGFDSDYASTTGYSVGTTRVSGYDFALGRDLFFGYVASSATPITSIQIVRSTTTNGNFPTGFDDLAFTNTVVPEPATGLAAALVGGLMILRRRRA